VTSTLTAPASDVPAIAAGGEAKSYGPLGDIMGKEARIALLLAETSFLLAVVVEWVVQELSEAEQQKVTRVIPLPRRP
jgi:hypothetical protein